MLEEKGYPFKSKEHSQNVMEWKNGCRNKLLLSYFNQSETTYYKKCPQKLMYQIEDDFKLKISHKCCQELKKKPISRWEKENNRFIGITGMRRSEGGFREGLNCIITDKENKLKKFHPLAIVSNEFENYYLQLRNIELCKLYYPPYSFDRTGCKGCPFALGLNEELQTMRTLLPNEAKQCEIIWKPVYEEYRRIGFRLQPLSPFNL